MAWDLPSLRAAVIERVSSATMAVDPFPHLIIDQLLPSDFYEELIAAIPSSERFDRCTYPGTSVDRAVTDASPFGLVLPDSNDGPVRLARDVVQSNEFAQALFDRFTTAPATPEEGGIPPEKHRFFSEGAEDYTTVVDLHRDLPGYEITPHPDIESKIVTFLLYLEPDDALAPWGTHLCAPRRGLSYADVAAAPSFDGNGGWRSWDLFDSTTVAPACPNTLLAFAPHERSYHAVRMDIPEGHPRRERTAIRGFIRAGAATENWVYPYQSLPRRIVASATAGSKKTAARALSRGRRAARQVGFDRPELDALVVSAGGASTTQLLEFLAQRIEVNDRNSFVDGLKHLNSPFHPLLGRVSVNRAVYLVADPREVVLSLFRRDYAGEMVGKLSAEHRTPLGYRRHVERHTDVELDLESVVQGEIDPFGLDAHWREWTSETPPFPILTVRYDQLPAAVPEILEFVGLSRDLAAEFPAWVPRASKLGEQPASVREGLDRLYGDLADRISAHPPWRVRG